MSSRLNLNFLKFYSLHNVVIFIYIMNKFLFKPTFIHHRLSLSKGWVLSSQISVPSQHSRKSCTRLSSHFIRRLRCLNVGEKKEEKKNNNQQPRVNNIKRVSTERTVSNALHTCQFLEIYTADRRVS